MKKIVGLILSLFISTAHAEFNVNSYDATNKYSGKIISMEVPKTGPVGFTLKLEDGNEMHFNIEESRNTTIFIELVEKSFFSGFPVNITDLGSSGLTLEAVHPLFGNNLEG